MNFQELRKYHRTFHYDHPRFGPPTIPRTYQNSYRDPPRMGSTGGRISSKPLHEAYLLNGTNLQRIIIEEKHDQNFTPYASRWEKVWSKLSRPWVSWSFLPIVDQDIMVVGHIGTVWGNELVFINDGAHGTGHERLNELLELGPVFVGTEQYYKESQKENYQSLGRDNDNANHRLAEFSVQTDVEGEVLSAEVVRVLDDRIESVDNPFSLIGDVRTVIRLGIGILVVKVGVKGARTLVRRVVAKRAAAKAAKAARAARDTYNPITGMTRKHHLAFVDAAQESQLIIVVRHTNPKSIQLIDDGCPGKPKNLEFINTSPTSGIVMANTSEEVLRAQRLGYFVVGEGKTARRLVTRNGKEVAEDMPVHGAFWQLEKGQVIDPTLKKPIVGDYDLMGVFEATNPGPNIGLVATNYELLTDVTNPFVQRASAAVNRRLDINRVLHGPQDMYKGFRKGASTYHPDGVVKHFETEDAVKAYYAAIGRQPRAGQYPRPSPGTFVDDELARRRR